MSSAVISPEQELRELQGKYNLTKEYLRRALLKLKKSTEFFDIEEDGSDELEEDIIKFINEVKRKRLV